MLRRTLGAREPALRSGSLANEVGTPWEKAVGTPLTKYPPWYISTSRESAHTQRWIIPNSAN
jgi:hypothetical protein